MRYLKKGDLAICICGLKERSTGEIKRHPLTKGKVYKVIAATYDQVHVACDLGTISRYLSSRFEKFNPKLNSNTVTI